MSEPLTDERLADIRAEAESFKRMGSGPVAKAFILVEVPLLLAEIDRLKAPHHDAKTCHVCLKNAEERAGIVAQGGGK